MFNVDMSTINPVGEFGSKSWCQACAEYGMKILDASNISSNLSWGFSEIYTFPPDRLVSPNRPQSGYHFMVSNGQVSGGDSVPEYCLAIPGFHAKLRWAYICNQSGSKYGSKGQKQRGLEESELKSQIDQYLGKDSDMGAVPNPVWPDPIIKAMREGAENGAGLHNIAATLQNPSPEFADMPSSELGVPSFSQMTKQQKSDFLDLCGIEY